MPPPPKGAPSFLTLAFFPLKQQIPGLQDSETEKGVHSMKCQFLRGNGLQMARAPYREPPPLPENGQLDLPLRKKFLNRNQTHLNPPGPQPLGTSGRVMPRRVLQIRSLRSGVLLRNRYFDIAQFLLDSDILFPENVCDWMVCGCAFIWLISLTSNSSKVEHCKIFVVIAQALGITVKSPFFQRQNKQLLYSLFFFRLGSRKPGIIWARPEFRLIY